MFKNKDRWIWRWYLILKVAGRSLLSKAISFFVKTILNGYRKLLMWIDYSMFFLIFRMVEEFDCKFDEKIFMLARYEIIVDMMEYFVDWPTRISSRNVTFHVSNSNKDEMKRFKEQKSLFFFLFFCITYKTIQPMTTIWKSAQVGSLLWQFFIYSWNIVHHKRSPSNNNST